jgi:hypothetical protein
VGDIGWELGGNWIVATITGKVAMIITKVARIKNLSNLLEMNLLNKSSTSLTIGES